MKKKIVGLMVTALLSTAVFAQVMKSSGIKNTLSTGINRGWAKSDGDHSGMINFSGFKDTFQLRADIANFTVESMLSWDLFKPIGDSNMKFAYAGSYVNFFVHPVKGLDIGAGTHLNWEVGKAPASGTSWSPFTHVVQGDLYSGKPGDNDVVGGVFYANKYSSTRSGNDAALGIRYAYNDLFEIGLTIPDNTSTKSFSFNAAAQVNPLDFLSVSVAYSGICRSYGDLYVGSSLYFKNLGIDLYFAGNFMPKSHNNVSNNLFGWGLAATISVPQIDMTIKPEVGFTDYMNPDYSFAWYIGNRFDITLADAFNIGLWFSYANGAENKYWKEGTDGGYVINVSPDIMWKITNRHSLGLVFDYEFRQSWLDTKKDSWYVDLSWTYRR